MLCSAKRMGGAASNYARGSLAELAAIKGVSKPACQRKVTGPLLGSLPL